MEEEHARKLAIVLHADVVGSTALVRANESVAHRRIRDAFQRLSETVSAQHGNTRELRGDALVAELPSASDAVEAALTFQADNSAFVQKLTDDIKPLVRIGIAMGEVVIADDTITGEAVVLAQRLEQLAAPGAICIQGIARETIPERLRYAYKELQSQPFKGFEKPIHVFEVSRTTDVTAERAAVVAPPPLVSLELPDEPSIAVLPFVNMSGDPEQQFFSDGITEDIITALSRISGLLVVARNSTMVYKDRAIDVKQVCLEQGVRYVLEGSVRKAENRVRITGQLVDGSTGRHLYAERFDRQLDDIFAVQDEITKRITVELQVQLTSGEQARLWAGATENVEACDPVSLPGL